VLPNGITILTRSNFSSPSVSVSGFLQAGSLPESDDKLGLADFVASSLMRGTERRTFDEIYGRLEAVGASLGFDSGTHTTSFGGRCLAEDLPLLVESLAETLRLPSFPEVEVEKLRAQLLTGLAIRAQDTADMASLVFGQTIFEGHPYSRPDDGFPETIRSITRDDLVAFHRRYFRPRGLVVAIVGAIKPDVAVAQVLKALGDWHPEGQQESLEAPSQEPLETAVERHHRIAGKSQSDLIIGSLGPRRKDPEYLPASLGNSVLGQFGMMGRIGEVVREKSGLAYYAHSSLNAGTGPGTWEVNAGVNPKDVKKAGALIEAELRRFVEDGVTVEELADSQSNYTGRLPLSLESNGGVAAALVNIERYDLGLDYYRRYAELVWAVTPAQVLEAARKHINPERLATAVAGP
jgi:zinc protease